MIIKAPSNTPFQPHPEGVFPAVLKSISEPRQETAIYEGKEKPRSVIDLTFQTAKGEVRQKYTASLHEASTLGKQLRRWGKVTNETAQAGFDLATLIGQKADVVILHDTNRKTNRTFVTIEAIFPPGSGTLSAAA
jgi:hypothetical protein